MGNGSGGQRRLGEAGGAERGEAVVGTCCMREELVKRNFKCVYRET